MQKQNPHTPTPLILPCFRMPPNCSFDLGFQHVWSFVYSFGYVSISFQKNWGLRWIVHQLFRNLRGNKNYPIKGEGTTGVCGYSVLGDIRKPFENWNTYIWIRFVLYLVWRTVFLRWPNNQQLENFPFNKKGPILLISVVFNVWQNMYQRNCMQIQCAYLQCIYNPHLGNALGLLFTML